MDVRFVYDVLKHETVASHGHKLIEYECVNQLCLKSYTI